MGQLNAYRHNGFWQCMDTMNEKKKLEEMWRSGNAPWKVWGERDMNNLTFFKGKKVFHTGHTGSRDPGFPGS